MIVDVGKSLNDYLDKANEITAELRAENGPLLRLMEDFYGYFATTLWREPGSVDPRATLLSMNAFLMWLAGVRTAMTSHVVAAFPVLRTALESACYGYLIAKTPSLGDTWSNRHRDEAARKACRAAFTGAVGLVAKEFDQLQPPDGGAWILEAYETAIDFGGHPNIRAVFGHVRVEDDSEDDPYFRVNLAGLYGAGHGETQRILFAALDFGLAIAVVLTRSLEDPDRTHPDELQRLNDRKNALADACSEGWMHEL